MDDELELAVADVFRDATMENVVRELRTEADWDRFNEIKKTATDAERGEFDRINRDKPKLVAEAVDKLQCKAGAKTYEHPTPFGTDRFNDTELERRANVTVENDHTARLLTIKTEEADAYSDLKQDIQKREGVRNHAYQSFTRATDRRAPTRSR